MKYTKFMAIYRTTSPFREFIIESKSIKGLMQLATRQRVYAIIDHLAIYEKEKNGYSTTYLFTYNRVNKKAPNGSFEYGTWA